MRHGAGASPALCHLTVNIASETLESVIWLNSDPRAERPSLQTSEKSVRGYRAVYYLESSAEGASMEVPVQSAVITSPVVPDRPDPTDEIRSELPATTEGELVVSTPWIGGKTFPAEARLGLM
jgi:hypothetical protein